MALLNYTTRIDPAKTSLEIHKLLIKAGARQILNEYDANANPTGLRFIAATPGGERMFALPVNVDAVYKVLVSQGVPGRYMTRDQARRTGWRILKDWVAAQLAIVETEMVSLDQVMLSYMVPGDDGRTVYDLYTERQLALGPHPGL